MRAAAAALAAGLAVHAAPGARAAAAASPDAKPAAPQARTPQRAVILATEVFRAADAVAHSLAVSQRIPAGGTVTLSDGRAEALSAARTFVLFARFLGNGYQKRMTPDRTPVPPPVIGPLEITAPTVGVSREVVIATADLLSQARPTADVAESTGNLPTAVWVQGLRLTPAQFMGALATILQHMIARGEAPQQVLVGNYLPPLDWNAPPASAVPSPATPLEPNPAAAETDALAPVPLAPVPAETAAAPSPPTPQLTVYVPSKSPLRGEQVLTIEYEGPPAFVRLFIDGKPKAVSNLHHFTYTWDTRLEPDGKHALRVVAVNDMEQPLAMLEGSLETANGNLPLRQG